MIEEDKRELSDSTKKDEADSKHDIINKPPLLNSKKPPSLKIERQEIEMSIEPKHQEGKEEKGKEEEKAKEKDNQPDIDILRKASITIKGGITSKKDEKH